MRTHCKYGHELTPENAVIRSDNGGRRCRICKNKRSKRDYWKDGKERTRVKVQTLDTILDRCEATATGCLIWSGFKNSRGYGRVTCEQRKWLVHRLVWVMTRGPITPGMQIDHVCHNEDPHCAGGDACVHRACCNVEHMREATNQMNTLAGKTIPAEWAALRAKGATMTREEMWKRFQHERSIEG